MLLDENTRYHQPNQGSQAELGSHSTRLVWLACLAIVVAFVGLRLTLIQPSSSERWSDPDDYMRVAQLPLTSLRFWAGPRVFGFPLLLKLLGNQPQLVIGTQFAIATLCWSLLAISFAACLRARWLRPVALGLILGFSLSLDIVQWDFMLFSESLASSLMALMIGLWLLLLRSYESGLASQRRAVLFGLLAIVTIGWSFVRDSNAYVVLGIAGLVGLALLGWWRRVPDRIIYAGLAGLLVAVFLVQNWAADAGRRWQYPLVNLIGKRILVDEQRTAFFAANAMPTDEKVMRYRDNFAHSHGNAIFRDADMSYFRDWLDTRGKSTYTRFLLSHPAAVLREPLREYRTILRPPLGYYGTRAGLTFPPWLLWLTGALYIRTPEPIGLAVGALTLAGFALAALRLGRPVWLAPAALALLIYPSMFLIWHGDAIDVGRHSYLIGVQLRLVFWMLCWFTVDLILSSIAERRRHASLRPATGSG
jgi:hypothetical protein